MRERTWVIAHRGDSFHAPENTLEAARRGWQAGADAWELDVRLSRDGVPVVVHDQSLRRTTDVATRFGGDPRGPSYLVRDFDLAEIRALDAGSWFLGPANVPRTAAAFGTPDQIDESDRARFASGEVRIPTLAEALELTRQLDWHVNIELKTTAFECAGVLDQVFDLLTDPAVAARVLVSSFDHEDVATLARLRPEIATGVLSATPLFQPELYVRQIVGATAYHPSIASLTDEIRGILPRDSFRLRSAALDALRLAEIPVYVYTVNDASPGGMAEQLAAAGVAGIFTDDPGMLVERTGRLSRSRTAHEDG
jgi:glycerophosphoryl diester phosphodiesterase